MAKDDVFAELSARGLVKDVSDATELRGHLRGTVAVYAGFDPTAGSLHAGHLVTLTLLRRLKAAGHRVIAVVGTATGLVGDPSGRNEARQLMDAATLEANVAGVERSIRSVLGQDADVRRNGDWVGGMGFVDFLREVGRHIPVPRMLALDSVRSRLTDGDGTISFMEFSYSLLQAYDFLKIAREFPVMVQIGGSDQWGNICMGLELIRKSGHEGFAFGMTHPLLTRSDGSKMGKTSKGAVWLNSDRLSDFDFFQFWRNVSDGDVVRLLTMLGETPAPLDLGPLDAEQANGLKIRLAREMTALVRGREASDEAWRAAQAVFEGDGFEGLPVIELGESELSDLPAVMVKAGVAETKSAARRLLEQGGVRLSGSKVAPGPIPLTAFDNGKARLTVGRKRHVVLSLGSDGALQDRAV